jgi:hypothetical protein
MRLGLSISVMLGVLAVAGCAGRSANPTQEATIHDRYMTCAQIRAEVARNYEAQSALVREQNAQEERNDSIMLWSIAFPPGFFAIDDTVEGDYGTSPQDIEHRALATRNRHLIAMAQAQGGDCWPGKDHWVRS